MGNVHQFFKYRKVDKWLIDSIVNQTIYFAPPDQLNDPFDCQPNLRQSITRATSHEGPLLSPFISQFSNDYSLISSIEKNIQRLGVCSFSRTASNPILWSHYANEHRGVCLLYEFDEDTYSEVQDKLILISHVKYGNDLITEWLRNERIAYENTLKTLTGFARIMLTCKSLAWRYEDEIRMIKLENGLFKLPKGSLAQICFGMRTPEHDVALIKRLASTHAGCQRFARIVRSDNDFGIEMVEEPPA